MPLQPKNDNDNHDFDCCGTGNNMPVDDFDRCGKIKDNRHSEENLSCAPTRQSVAQQIDQQATQPFVQQIDPQVTRSIVQPIVQPVAQPHVQPATEPTDVEVVVNFLSKYKTVLIAAAGAGIVYFMRTRSSAPNFDVAGSARTIGRDVIVNNVSNNSDGSSIFAIVGVAAAAFGFFLWKNNVFGNNNTNINVVTTAVVGNPSSVVTSIVGNHNPSANHGSVIDEDKDMCGNIRLTYQNGVIYRKTMCGDYETLWPDGYVDGKTMCGDKYKGFGKQKLFI